MSDFENLVKSDQQHLLHPFSNPRDMEENRARPLIMTGGDVSSLIAGFITASRTNL